VLEPVGLHAADPEVEVVRRGALAIVEERPDHGRLVARLALASAAEGADGAVVVEDDRAGLPGQPEPHPEGEVAGDEFGRQPALEVDRVPVRAVLLLGVVEGQRPAFTGAVGVRVRAGHHLEDAPVPHPRARQVRGGERLECRLVLREPVVGVVGVGPVATRGGGHR
jgi:hypothetical protein